jgi:C-terminal processing protease CtpA/Prc
MMFRAVEGATLVGLPTAGASGNPRPARLPNGVEVWFSRWVNELPDGTPTEGKGIPPHVRVEVGAEGDPILDRGLVEARKPAR